MDEVEYHKMTMWEWECPKCGFHNETEDDPSYQETVFCENGSCNGEYVPVPG